MMSRKMSVMIQTIQGGDYPMSVIFQNNTQIFAIYQLYTRLVMKSILVQDCV